jgi:hypothetical protein
MEALIVAGFAILGIAALVVTMAVMRGWVLSIMWDWFIVPLGVAALSIPAAIGVALVVGLLTHSSSGSNSTEKGELSDRAGRLVGLILSPLLILGMGAIVKRFL